MIDNLLNKISFWRDLPYPTKGAILRAIRAGLSVAISILLTAALEGVLFPPDWSPIIVIALTGLLQAIDKFLREWKLANELNEMSLDVPEEVVE